MTSSPLKSDFGSALPSDPDIPSVPANLEETGLSDEFLTDLLLKTLYTQGARTGQQLVEGVCLPFPVVDDQLLTLQQRRMIEVRGTSGPSRGGYTFDLGASGRERAREATTQNQYVGPAPVPLEQYRRWVDRQSINHMQVNRATVEEGFSQLVLEPGMTDQLGPAINSGKSLFLHGDSGNGKTAIAEIISKMLGGDLFVPYALEIDGQVIVIYDPVYHRKVSEPRHDDVGKAALEKLWIGSRGAYDARFAKVERPVVLTGGELTLEQLDLQYDFDSKMYQAPFQMKANGGVLIVDDFGRQRVPPRDLLNRWIVPLEKRIDYLTLHTGGKFPVPFDCLLIFATNIDPRDLVEEAFLRRIHYKIEVGSPTREQYLTIFHRYCQKAGIRFTKKAVDYIYTNFYERYSIAPRGCHPRDLIDHVRDIAKYRDEDPLLSAELMDRACRSYFLDFPTTGGK
jgi:predicted ATPase with chaperone activity